MNQIEREYREALGQLRFSQEAKERMMNNLTQQREERPAKGRKGRALRLGLAAAAVCAALAGTAGAATFALRQANIHFFDDWDEYVQAQRAKSEEDGVDYGITLGYGGLDYDETTPLDMDAWWNGKEQAQGGEFAATIVKEETAGGYTIVTDTQGIIGAAAIEDGSDDTAALRFLTLVEEAAGTQADGWTAKRVFRCEVEGRTYLTARYRAEALSGYDSLWKGWDTAWLESRYASVPDNTWFESVDVDGTPCRTSILGEFRGEGDTAFNVQYSWNSDFTYGDENRPGSIHDYTGHYTTADGVTAAIETDTSHTGKTMFWVSVRSGHSSFSMFGTQVELDELYAILDSLNLSNLLETAPAE